jgi:hypothetical protein
MQNLSQMALQLNEAKQAATTAVSFIPNKAMKPPLVQASHPTVSNQAELMAVKCSADNNQAGQASFN